MKLKKNITITVIAIITISIALGFVYNGIMTFLEKRTYIRPYEDIVTAASEKWNVPEALIYAVMFNESSFDEKSLSGAGAYGLMQLTAVAYCDMNELDPDSFDPEEMYDVKKNIDTGTHYLAWLYSEFGDWDNTIAAYNGGIGNVRKWLADPNHSDDGITLKSIPFTETRNYLRRVNDTWNTYKRLYY